MATIGQLEAREVARVSKLSEVDKGFGETDLPGKFFADNKAIREDLDNQILSRTAFNKANEIS